MVKKESEKLNDIENLKYEVAQEMGLPRTKKKKERGHISQERILGETIDRCQLAADKRGE